MQVSEITVHSVRQREYKDTDGSMRKNTEEPIELRVSGDRDALSTALGRISLTTSYRPTSFSGGFIQAVKDSDCTHEITFLNSRALQDFLSCIEASRDMKLEGLSKHTILETAKYLEKNIRSQSTDIGI